MHSQLIGKERLMPSLAQFEGQMIVAQFRKERRIDKANCDGGTQRCPILALVQLLLVQCRPIVQRSLAEYVGGQHLHLDQELSAALITGLDIDDRELGAFECLFIERVEQFQAGDVLAGRGLQDSVQQADQRRLALFASEDVLEGVIDLGINLGFHAEHDNATGPRLEHSGGTAIIMGFRTHPTATRLPAWRGRHGGDRMRATHRGTLLLDEALPMTEVGRCPECGAELAVDAPSGLCSTCRAKSRSQSRSGEKLAETGPLGSRFTAPKPEELARRFPQLEIIELLGQGGMGAVYKARQPTLDRLVAVKILPTEIAGDPAFAERLVGLLRRDFRSEFSAVRNARRDARRADHDRQYRRIMAWMVTVLSALVCLMGVGTVFFPW